MNRVYLFIRGSFVLICGRCDTLEITRMARLLSGYVTPCYFRGANIKIHMVDYDLPLNFLSGGGPDSYNNWDKWDQKRGWVALFSQFVTLLGKLAKIALTMRLKLCYKLVSAILANSTLTSSELCVMN